METIWKFPLQITDRQIVRMPINSWLISVQEQNGQLVLWAVVPNSKSPRTQDVEISILGTGNPFDEIPGYFLGTVQTMGGKLVWHVFHRTIGPAIDVNDPVQPL